MGDRVEDNSNSWLTVTVKSIVYTTISILEWIKRWNNTDEMKG